MSPNLIRKHCENVPGTFSLEIDSNQEADEDSLSNFRRLERSKSGSRITRNSIPKPEDVSRSSYELSLYTCYFFAKQSCMVVCHLFN